MKNMEFLRNGDVVGDIHLLSDTWKLWYWKFSGSVSVSIEWMENLHELCVFDSVEKFWRYLMRIIIIYNTYIIE